MSNLQGWTPYRAVWQQGRMMIDWLHLDQQRLTEPFFENSVVSAYSHPFNQAFQRRTPVEALVDLPAGIRPSGFIFHWSRCGSTLCSQALAALPENIVISEGAPLNGILRAQYFGPATAQQRRTWLAGLVNAYGQPRFVQERRLFIKFMSSHILDLPLIAEAFPEVPWIFVYRDPLEIVVSHLVQPSSEFVKGMIHAGDLGLSAETADTQNEESYIAHCLAAIGKAALRYHRPGFSRLLNFTQLPAALTTELPQMFGLRLAEAELQQMRAVSGRHAKYPKRAYADDRKTKQDAASPELREVVARLAGPVYAALEQARLADSAAADKPGA